jgi:tetratricopeptide (TPR) repeat protein
MTEKIREVEQSIAEEADELYKMKLMIQLIGLYFEFDLQKGLVVADEAYRFAEQLGDETGMARAILGMGNCNVKMGNYAIALEQLRAAYATLEKLGEIKFASTALLNLAVIYNTLGDYNQGLDYMFQCLKMAREGKNEYIESICLRNISSRYYLMQNIDGALDMCLESLKLAEKLERENGDITAKLQSLSMLGVIYLHGLHDAETAKNLFEDALLLVSGEQSPRHSVTEIYDNLGEIEFGKGNYASAREYFAKGFEVSKTIGNKRGQIYPLINLAKTARAEQEWTEALKCIETAWELAEEIKANDVGYAVQEEYSQYYRLIGDYTKALEHYEKFHQLKEKLFNEESQRKIHNLSILHEVEKTKSEKELAEKEREIVQLKNVELFSALEEVRALNERLVQLNREKNEVLGVVAHDLKSPLSGIRMVSSMLKEYYATMSGEELSQQLATVEQTSDRMLGIVTNLLDVHAIESGRVYNRHEPVDVGSVVKTLVAGYREIAGRKRIELQEAYPPDTVLIDGSLEAVQQISENLLSFRRKRAE